MGHYVTCFYSEGDDLCLFPGLKQGQIMVSSILILKIVHGILPYIKAYIQDVETDHKPQTNNDVDLPPCQETIKL